MNSKEKKNVDTRINEIIIRTTAILASVFATIGLVMSQVFGNGRFYELLGWSMTLAIPFVISAIISVLVVGYGPELPLPIFQTCFYLVVHCRVVMVHYPSLQMVSGMVLENDK